ncbi:PorT family protein [Parapedobacter sp. ISTM3]|uniref:porin family protein n=1 Tax=Parapedobacter sp. ISTM3 TaxID=2800130 RepID=UPI00190775FF|nr:porin family protein [Parapedobacter sp. ISTM3]MBK1439268.1 PorT family protein [Parapedobacter sp. ISTM3]
MKKNVLTFASAVGALIFSFQLSAQDNPVSIGFKAGSSLSNYRLSGNMKGFKSKMNIGGSVGGFVRYDLTQNFALQSGIDVYYRTSKLESTADRTTNKIKSFGVEVPIFGIVQGELGSGKAFIGAGPYVGYGISTKSNGVNLFKNNSEAGRPAMNRFDYGVGGIIGYDFDKNWQINANYQLGLADLQKAKGGSMKSHVASIGVAYKF